MARELLLIYNKISNGRNKINDLDQKILLLQKEREEQLALIEKMSKGLKSTASGVEIVAIKKAEKSKAG